jgi:hypothetical protein
VSQYETNKREAQIVLAKNVFETKTEAHLQRLTDIQDVQEYKSE